MIYVFNVDGNPVTKKRPRVTRFGTYTDKRTRQAEGKIAAIARANGVKPLAGPVTVRLRFCCEDKRRRDIDNLGKTVLDALNGIAFEDDSQIVALDMRKECVCKGSGTTFIQIEG